MSVTIQATVTCDHLGCDASTKADFQLTTDDRDIPSLEIESDDSNRDWHIRLRPTSSWRDTPACLCPEHYILYK